LKIPEMPAIESIGFMIKFNFENAPGLDDSKYSLFFADKQ